MSNEHPDLVPLRTIKVKINGRCMNACRFCTFHGRKERLEWEHVERVLRAAPGDWRGQLLINGGEPTLHPRFVSIARRLGALRPRLRVGLGTNLRLFERMASGRQVSDRVIERWTALCSCFDLVQIGCDDEHRNLRVVRRLVPRLREQGVEVYLNCLLEAASEQIRSSLRTLDRQTGSITRFGHVTPRGEARPSGPVSSAPGLCVKRRRELLVDCDGALFFCFNQELARPVGMLQALGRGELRALVRYHVPAQPYAACASCDRFEGHHERPRGSETGSTPKSCRDRARKSLASSAPMRSA